jgi:hypothetical protein
MILIVASVTNKMFFKSTTVAKQQIADSSQQTEDRSQHAADIRASFKNACKGRGAVAQTQEIPKVMTKRVGKVGDGKRPTGDIMSVYGKIL